MIKNPEQIEVADIFARLEKKHGLTKAEVARELRIERGYVGYLVTGKRNPSLRTLEQFRDLERRLDAPNGLGGLTGSAGVELDALIRVLSDLKRNDKPKFEAAKTIIQSLSPESSSVVKHKSAKLLKKASASARRGG